MPVRVGRAPTVADAYAACDLVVYPSTWEGFGNPVVESIAHRRPIVVGSYPVLDELRAFGVELLSIDDPAGAIRHVREPDVEMLERNVERVRPHCSVEQLPARLAAVLDRFEVSRMSDSVTARRARIARWVAIGKRTGYLLLGAAVVLFVIAAVTDFPAGVVTATLVALIAACVVLPVPIVLGYGLRAAERDERRGGGGRTHPH